MRDRVDGDAHNVRRDERQERDGRQCGYGKRNELIYTAKVSVESRGLGKAHCPEARNRKNTQCSYSTNDISYIMQTNHLC